MKGYRFVPLARTDYFDLIDFYEARQAGLGDRFADDVERFVRRVRQFPLLYHSVSRLPPSRDVRIGATRRFKAVLVYEVTATHVVVLSVSHRKRRRRPWRQRLGP